ncbi:spore wall and anchoring disk complex protein EnP1 [Encephalitozoon intestinalis ATCC 50506]|uniref:Spore wall and anchoring disk complex protein EnP1 n=2 Tax=Encephalitozoon intestinalis TaxID=58839 RepID=ENP1_ENCIN|nr:spore wall and anchoring disk complex protein EnP1 [Encephalitozoon intestinalis ATCC 50506]A7TZU4.1 RecName: Full=Spore wall and anchoring disk complex protein EnP1; AltName: Full=Host cell adhesion protein EnP1; Flags: Precursor [Encephalitozoon intestinalis]ABU24317.1 spore wall and anchoring disk complex protein [Encephalitozoon intestinalis]ADM10934.1 spore wall and anchoring disk complex protein EnP1 [Encephalitozoon intestinalis ATCC 50506]UTX44568.1 spore wall and anchoring disk comp
MKLLGLLISAFGAINALKIKALYLSCDYELRPYNAVIDSQCMAFALNGSNIHEAIRYLNAMNIDKAYVLYWNDHDLHQNPMVLHKNGALAPFDRYTNTAKHVLCVEACSCPGPQSRPVVCPENNGASVSSPCPPCGQGNNTTVCDKVVVNPQPVKPLPAPCTPCAPCESSSSEKSESKECMTFPRICKKKCGPRHGRSPKKVEIVKSQKTYTFDIERYKRRGDVVVRVCSQDCKDKFEKFVLTKTGEIRKGKDKKCIPEPLPECLQCPKNLYKLKSGIEAKVCSEVCMYINSKCEIFVLIGDCDFYKVVMNERRRKQSSFHLKKIRGQKLRELIRQGLFGVEFSPLKC